MENISKLVSQLEATETTVSEVIQKLKKHLLQLDSHIKEYDFLKNDSDLKDKVVMYYRRMMAHELRLIKENDTLRFENICRNAHLQMEGMLSYFFKEKFRTVVAQFIAEHKGYVDEINKKAGRTAVYHMPSDRTWSRITFAEKNFLFQKYTLDSKLYAFVKLLTSFRNSISHIGYVDKNSPTSVEATVEVRAFASSQDVNAVLEALTSMRDYVSNW